MNPASESTTTALTPTIASSTTYGSETTETFAGTVTGQSGDGIPQGTVTVSYGSATTLCTVNPLSGGSGNSVGFSCSLTATQLPSGTYSNVVATFTSTGASSNPNFTYTGSASSPAQSFTVSPEAENTTTALTPTIASSTTYGSETTETFAGTVTGQSGDGIPQGTVTVSYGSATTLCQSTLSGGSGDVANFSCSLTATQLPSGPYTNVVATYAAGTSSNGDFSYNGSASSPAQSFTVSPEAENTTTVLNAVTSPITFGSETTETFTGTVTGQSGDGFPQGTVTVSYGSPTQTQLCQSTLSGGSGDVANFSCSLTASQLPAATYSSVVATYAAGTSSNGDFSYNTSTSTPAQSFTVNSSVSIEPTTTSLTPTIASSTTYGSETTESFAGTVTGQSGDGYPEGTVTVYYGSPTQVALCSQLLPAGSGDVSSFTCSLTATQLGVGSYTSVVAVYSPGGTSSSNASFTYTTSTSSPVQSFTVNPASESTTTALTPTIASSTTYGSETTETFAGTVTGQSGDGIPQGTVTVSYGSATTLCTVNPLSGGSGNSVGFSCSLTATQLPSGTYSNVVATFTSTGASSNPNFTYTGSASSPAQSFTVSPEAENTTTALTPTIASSTTYGSETTETFAGTVTGQSGDGIPQGTVTVSYGSATTLCQSTLSGGSGDVANFSCSLTATQLPSGPYTNVVATYAAGTSSNGDFSYNGSASSPAQSFTVSPEAENTTTVLNAVTSPITFGSETTETFTGTVTGQSGDGFPQGTVTVSYGSPTQTQLCQSTLSGGSGDVANFSCSLTASQLPAATYSSVVATYAAGTSSNGDFSYNTSTSTPAQSFTVNSSVSIEPTTTSLTPTIASSTTYGSETTESFAGTVTGQSGDGYPEGTVTVYYGSPTQVALCSQLLPAGSGDVSSFTCSLTATQLGVGSYTSVVAVYSPGGTSSSNASFTYTTSTSSPVQSFTVNPASESTTTALTPTIASSTTYGSETTETFAGTVTGQSGDGIPQGTVTVSYGSATTLCTVNPLSGGSGNSVGFSCSLTATQLPSGTYSNVVATFTSTGASSNPNFTYTGSASSPAQSFTVSPEAENTTTALTPTIASSTTYGSETTETFAGTVTGQSGDGIPQGTVTVSYGSATTLCQSTLSGGSGDVANFSCSLTATQLPSGPYTNVVATYAAGTSSNGDFSYNGSASSPAQSFTVSPEAENTTTVLNAVTSPITFGSETTETFTGTVTGQSGDGFPQGTVTVSYGSPTQTQLCQSTLSGGSGDVANFSCSLTASQLPAATYSSVVATYAAGTSSNGNFSYNTSTSTPAQSFTVNPATTSPNNLRIQMSSLGLVSGVGGLYVITVTNLASTATTGTVTVTDALPAGLSYVGVFQPTTAFHCSAALGIMTCTNTSAIPAHASDYMLLAVRVSARSGTMITDTVNLTPVGTPASNYTATVKSTVR